MCANAMKSGPEVIECRTWGCGRRWYLSDLGTGLATTEVRFPDDHKSKAAGTWIPYCDYCASRFKTKPGFQTREISRKKRGK